MVDKVHLPTKFWRVRAFDIDGNLHYWEGAGKTYADEKHARSKLESLRNRGMIAALYETEEIKWKVVDV